MLHKKESMADNKGISLEEIKKENVDLVCTLGPFLDLFLFLFSLFCLC